MLALAILSVALVGAAALAVYGAAEQLDWRHARADVLEVEGSEFPVLRFQDAREQWWDVPAWPSDEPGHIVDIRYRPSDPTDVTRSGRWTIAIGYLVAAAFCAAWGLLPSWALANELMSAWRDRQRRSTSGGEERDAGAATSHARPEARR